ncbi:hypothetical protein VYU27_008766 [Nannochloropsis oceanica]
MYSQASQYSQEDYLTPATQDNAAAGSSFLPSHFALASPSPIKKKSRSSRRGSNGATARQHAMMMSVLPEGAALHDGGHLQNNHQQGIPQLSPSSSKMMMMSGMKIAGGGGRGEEANPNPPEVYKMGMHKPLQQQQQQQQQNQQHSRRHHNRPPSSSSSSSSSSFAAAGAAADAAAAVSPSFLGAVVRDPSSTFMSTGSTASSSSSSSSSSPPVTSTSFLPPPPQHYDGFDDGDFRNLHSQPGEGGRRGGGLSQSVVECFGSLRMNEKPSPADMRREEGREEDEVGGDGWEEGREEGREEGMEAMQCSQDLAQGFRLKSVGANWGEEEEEEEEQGGLKERQRSVLAAGAAEGGRGIRGGVVRQRPAVWNGEGGGGGSEGGEGGEYIQVVSIPPCNFNPFSSTSSSNSDAPEGRKRHRQRKIKIPCTRGWMEEGGMEGGREGGRAGGREGGMLISRYLMEFEQLEMIGAGRFSMVHRVKKRLDGWVYAIKRSRHSLETEGEKEGALREVWALAALQGCPQLVRYMGAWMEEKRLYILTEFCRGGSVEREIFGDGEGREGGKGEEWLLRMVRDVGLALEFMHERGIVHMDVKPGNILIVGEGGAEGGREGGFKLADLGHAIKADGSMPVAEGDER